jgi:hypothetical protein
MASPFAAIGREYSKAVILLLHIIDHHHQLHHRDSPPDSPFRQITKVGGGLRSPGGAEIGSGEHLDKEGEL